MKNFSLLGKILLVGVAVITVALFFWEFQIFGLWFFALLSLAGIALALSVVLFVVSGVITYATVRFSKEPVVEPIDITQVDIPDRVALDEVAKEIQGLGFSHEGDFKLEFAAKHDSYTRVFVDGSRTVLAQLAYSQFHGAKVVVLEFATLFDDDTAIETMNHTDTGVLKVPKQTTVYYYPQYSAKELLARHREHAEMVEGKAMQKIGENVQEVVLRGIKKLLDAQVVLGVFQKNTRSEYYRYTWYGAFAAVGRPMKGAFKFWGRRKAEKDKKFGLKTGISQFFLTAFFVAVAMGIYFKMTGSTTLFSTLLMVVGSFGILITYGGAFMKVQNKWLHRVKNAVLALLIIVGIILLFGAISEQTFLYLIQEPIPAEEIAEAPEVRAWLSDNANPSAFASNRFFTTENALAFVDSLYDAGAEEVLVYNIFEEEWRIQEEGGPYADSLIVKLPGEVEQRALLFDLAARESIREGFAPETDQGQEYIYFWWD